MADERMPITPEVLTWAREKANFTINELAGRIRRSSLWDWERGLDAPTYAELEELAEQLQVPVAVFFFPEPPQLPLLDRKFATLEPQLFYSFSPRIQFLLYKADEEQRRLAPILSKYDGTTKSLVRDLRISTSDQIPEIADLVRDYIGVTLDSQFDCSNDHSWFNFWRTALFQVGVWVRRMNFNQDDFSGFALYDDYFPIIYVNTANSWCEDIFSMFHSLVHLLFHTSGVDKRNDGYLAYLAPDNRRIEELCNDLSTEIVVPTESLRAEFDMRRKRGRLADVTSELAYSFGVPEKWLNKKLLTLELISDTDFEKTLNIWSVRPRIGGGGGGGRVFPCIGELGKPLLGLLFNCYDRGLIDEATVADYVSVASRDLSELRYSLESGIS